MKATVEVWDDTGKTDDERWGWKAHRVINVPGSYKYVKVIGFARTRKAAQAAAAAAAVRVEAAWAVLTEEATM